MANFILHVDFIMPWTRDAMTQDLSHHRVRQSLWDRLTSKLDDHAPLPPCIVCVDRWMAVLRQFLTARNGAINGDMRLAFDVALREMRGAAKRVIGSYSATPAPSASSDPFA